MSSIYHSKGSSTWRIPLWVLAILSLVILSVAWPAQSKTKVSFGVPDWPGEQVKADVASYILSELGYAPEINNVSWIIGLRGVASGELDIDMALWRPTQNTVLNPMLDKGEVKILTVNVKDALYGLVVPDYVWDAGVHSIADLVTHADKFDHKIYGIEAGNDGNQIMLDAIDKNTYGLSKFNLVESSEAGMLSEAGEKLKQQGWMVFLGWRPHWMNVVYDLKFLEDPEEIWGGGSTVNTVVRPDYPDQEPNVSHFIEQMVIPSDTQSEWIYDYGYKELPSKDVAKNWIEHHLDLVKEWLDGVTTADGGKAAFEVIQQSFE